DGGCGARDRVRHRGLSRRDDAADVDLVPAGRRDRAGRSGGRAARGRAAQGGDWRGRAPARDRELLLGRRRPEAGGDLRAGHRVNVLRSPWLRAGVVVAGIVGVVALLWFHGPDWHTVGQAFTAVRWEWVAVAIGFNLLSVVARAFAWTQVIDAAIPKPWPRFRSIFSAFSVGLMANATLPGRIGELARVAVLVRKLPRRRALWATLVGTVFAHRVFDIVPVVLLIVYVLITAKIPAWATTSLIVFVAAGIGLFAFAFASAKLQHGSVDGLGAFRRVVAMARQGLSVMRIGPRAALAIMFQILGWL